MQYNSTYPVAGYPDRLRSSGKFVENSIKLTCLEITRLSDQVHCSVMASRTLTQAWSKRYRQVGTVNSKNRTSNWQCKLFSKKNAIVRIFCISEWLAVLINPDWWELYCSGKCSFNNAACVLDNLNRQYKCKELNLALFTSASPDIFRYCAGRIWHAGATLAWTIASPKIKITFISRTIFFSESVWLFWRSAFFRRFREIAKSDY